MDTPLLLTTLPVEFRHRTVVAAASDYFFDRTWKAVLSSFALATIPIERSRVNRKSGDTAAELIEDGWNLVIFPEGGRSPDGWTQPFTAGAAYLARRTGRPVVPVYLHGTRHVLPKSAESDGERTGWIGHRVAAQQPAAPRPDRRALRRAPLPRRRGEHPPVLGPVEAAVATLSREVHSDWWQARRSVSAVAPLEGPRRRTADRRPHRGAAPGRSTSPRHGSEEATGPTELV